jgi:hypothetical protein
MAIPHYECVDVSSVHVPEQMIDHMHYSKMAALHYVWADVPSDQTVD